MSGTYRVDAEPGDPKVSIVYVTESGDERPAMSIPRDAAQEHADALGAALDLDGFEDPDGATSAATIGDGLVALQEAGVSVAHLDAEAAVGLVTELDEVDA